ncbi:major facilitator superfamily domain-containing protein [Lineolata rhizophorae]|uniref:Major facilitator superfamily domain-containing protein n=1 Tax=Lineolata rhizophorae TaxID=578093 RepID=A0A6A6P8P9_9PEZI|nr:major facilitator superfamily domain-containing protein [Lineolata rhizophorae]
MVRWKKFSMSGRSGEKQASAAASTDDFHSYEKANRPERWTLGILNDKETDEVPGSILLLSAESKRNEPLGLRNTPARTSASSLPSPYPPSMLSRRSVQSVEKKRTPDGKIVLDPQPSSSPNDPLNWPAIRRDAALLSIGFYCMVGGGMTPILAAGFHDIAEAYDVSVSSVALTTGLYMMGLGVGAVVVSPTAILYGKRPVYLFTAIIFILTNVWCALSPSYVSLLLARIVQGIAMSPIECLPSASVAEIFFLHERAYRLGIYTLLLLGGKNLVPLVSAVIIQSLGWEWVFWIVAMIGGFGFALLFLFVPETFWDRTPRPRKHSHHTRKSIASHMSHMTRPASLFRRTSHMTTATRDHVGTDGAGPSTPGVGKDMPITIPETPGTLAQRRRSRHVGFQDSEKPEEELPEKPAEEVLETPVKTPADNRQTDGAGEDSQPRDFAQDGEVSAAEEKGGPSAENGDHGTQATPSSPASHKHSWKVEPKGGAPLTPELRNLNSPYYQKKAKEMDYFSIGNGIPSRDIEAGRASIQTPPGGDTPSLPATPAAVHRPSMRGPIPSGDSVGGDMAVSDRTTSMSPGPLERHVTYDPPSRASSHTRASDVPVNEYTAYYHSAPPKTFLQTLKPWNPRLHKDKWWKVALRPFVLFGYPAVLWSTLVYSLSVGWLIVLSESVSEIYRNQETYNFTALQTGLVYLSPFIGGVLGTAVAGKVSDVIVRYMSRRNGGIYEPEFRLVMAIPVAVCTTIGLMGFGWSAEERQKWIVPTIFFGIISFGCSLGSTTSITFCVDSYRQYAGEALVTLNFSKNIFHGLVFSLFFNHWLESDGPKDTFVALGGIQMACLLFTIPMYIFGKRARMWTVRKNLMEKL